jgi:ADP-heptose:LPS heptosyltransferase
MGKVGILKFIDHWVGWPICFSLSLIHRITHPFYHIALDVPIKKKPKAILVIKFFGLGSIILSSPLLRQIKKTYPHTKLIFLTFKHNCELVKRLGLNLEVRTINVYNLGALLCSIFSNLFYFSLHKPEVSLDLEFYSKFSTIMSYLSGAKWRVGFYLAQFWRNSLVNVPVYFNYARHILEIYKMVGTSIGLNMGDLTPSLIEIKREDKDFINRWFMERKVNAKDFLVGVNINASELALCRKWPKERFAAVINTLLKENRKIRIVLTGNSEEKAYTRSIFKLLKREVVDRVFNSSGLLNLGQFIALLSRLQLLLTNDSGPFHLAKAQGTPTISIWGPGSPDLYGPYRGERSSHKVIYKRWPCSPCLYIYRTDAGYFCRKKVSCLKDISDSEVVSLVQTTIEEIEEKGLK